MPDLSLSLFLRFLQRMRSLFLSDLPPTYLTSLKITHSHLYHLSASHYLSEGGHFNCSDCFIIPFFRNCGESLFEKDYAIAVSYS